MLKKRPWRTLNFIFLLFPRLWNNCLWSSFHLILIFRTCELRVLSDELDVLAICLLWSIKCQRYWFTGFQMFISSDVEDGIFFSFYFPPCDLMLLIQMAVYNWRICVPRGKATELFDCEYSTWVTELGFRVCCPRRTTMTNGEERLELKFRLSDGSDIGPSTYAASTTIATLKEQIIAEWPQG